MLCSGPGACRTPTMQEEKMQSSLCSSKGHQISFLSLLHLTIFLETEISLFARKEMLLFPMSIWAKSAQHQMPSVLSAIPGALIYVTEINSDPAELRWCLWRLAGSLVPHRSWAAGGASTGVRSGMNLSLQHQCLISTNLCYQSWNKRKWDKMLNRWSLFHSPQDLALNHEELHFPHSRFNFYILRSCLLLKIKPATGHQHLVNEPITRDIQFKKSLTLHKFLTPG